MSNALCSIDFGRVDGFDVTAHFEVDVYATPKEHEYMGRIVPRRYDRCTGELESSSRPAPWAVTIHDRDGAFWYVPDDGYSRSEHVARIVARDGVGAQDAERTASEELRHWGRMLAFIDADPVLAVVEARRDGLVLGADRLGGLLLEHGADCDTELRETIAVHGMVSEAVAAAAARVERIARPATPPPPPCWHCGAVGWHHCDCETFDNGPTPSEVTP